MTGEIPKKSISMPPPEDGLPRLEHFVESREAYIKALEATIQALKKENLNVSSNNLAIRSSIDELVAMQRLSNTISTATDPEFIVSALIDLTRQVIPVMDSNIFLFEGGTNRMIPLSSRDAPRLLQEAQQQMEAGIVDWVIAEKKTVVIPDLNHMMAGTNTKNFVIVPLILRGQGIGIYVIHTEKSQPEFSNQDVQLLSVLANQAAIGVENWRAYRQVAQANEELRISHAQVVQAAKLAAIGELAAGVAHEIKNPLQVLLLHLELVEHGRPAQNWTEMFKKQVKRLSDITHRLMSFARNISEDVKMEPLSLKKVIDDVVAMVHHEFTGSGIKISLAIPEGLPQLCGNANYLQQVFLNLLLNARDAMPEGGTIGADAAVVGGQIVLRMTDSGSGMSQEVLDRIFQPFFTTKGEKGTGLGLSICQKIIRQHMGEITAESQVGKGTTFTINLPVWRSAT